MFLAQTPLGKSGFILRGAWTPRGKKNIAKVSVLDEGSVERVIWDLSGVGGTFEMSIFPSRVNGAGASDEPLGIFTSAAEASVDGAAGEVTYAWTQTGGTGSWIVEQPFEAKTRFEAVGVPAFTTETAEFTCTATDSAGRTASATVDATVRSYGG